MRTLLTTVLLLSLLVSMGCDLLPISNSRNAMGTVITITVHEKSPTLHIKYIDAVIDSAFEEIHRIERLTYYEQLRTLNASSGYDDDIVVGEELIMLINNAYDINEMSRGAFCPFLEPVTSLWGFSSGRRELSVPPLWDIDSAMVVVDSTYFIQVNDSTARLTPKGAGLDLGGYAKGYAVDRAVAVLQDLGITAGIVEAGGDLRCFGTKPSGEPWEIGVRHPRHLDSLYTTIRIDSGAVATSGDYENYFIVDGVRYHHILDPLNGQPSYRSTSTTVIAKSCAEADAWATALFVLGPRQGVEMAEEMDLETLILQLRGEKVNEAQTPGFERLRVKPEDF